MTPRGSELLKTMDEWFRDHPVMLVNVMRAQINASHIILLEELRTMQDKPFNAPDEITRLTRLQQKLAEMFDLQYEQELLRKLKEKREARQREREKK